MLIFNGNFHFKKDKMEELLHFFNKNNCKECIPGIYTCSRFYDPFYLRILSSSIISRENIEDGRKYEIKWNILENTQEIDEMDDYG